MKLEEIIAARIPASMLERVVFDQGLIGKADCEALFKPSGLAFLELALKVVEAYGALASRLAYGLYEQVYDTDSETAELLFDHFKWTGAAYHNHQASLVGRIPTLPLDKFNEFLNSIKGQVCLIVSRKGSGEPARGTGFLVGPDLVLTCKHVLKQFPEDADMADGGNRVEVYFDFHRGEPVEGLGADLPETRKVALAKDWCVASCPAADPDGLPGELSPQDAARIGTCLDFILLRLSEKVGLQPMERGGGRQRLWVDLSTAALPNALEGEDWIIIPQHPNGLPQRIDMGRYRKSDPTNTRLRYDTNTAPGSSGAPCFNQKFLLVGLHNAFVGPTEKPLANQAIRATCIAPLLQKHLTAIPSSAGYVPRWSTARDGEPPRVILGRDKLLAWLQASATARPKTLADRVYAADSDVPGAGCSFSIDILHAEIRDTKTPRAVYGQRGQQLPATAEDFLLSLLRELGIPLEAGAPIPDRPTASSTGTASGMKGEADKLQLWISQELPDWLGERIDKHITKQIDAREPAQRAVAELESNGIDVPAKLRATADSPDPVWVRPNVWDYAYVVLDDLRSSNYPGAGPRTEFKGEARELIAALVQGRTGPSIHPGLLRLRWMFLGYLPDFLPAAGTDGNGATVETLDPAAVGKNEILGIFGRMSQAHIRMREGSDLSWRLAADLVLRLAKMSGAAQRLASLQREASFAAADVLKEMES